jgi:hypothetical protein
MTGLLRHALVLLSALLLLGALTTGVSAQGEESTEVVGSSIVEELPGDLQIQINCITDLDPTQTRLSVACTFTLDGFEVFCIGFVDFDTGNRFARCS